MVPPNGPNKNDKSTSQPSFITYRFGMIWLQRHLGRSVTTAATGTTTTTTNTLHAFHKFWPFKQNHLRNFLTDTNKSIQIQVLWHFNKQQKIHTGISASATKHAGLQKHRSRISSLQLWKFVYGNLNRTFSKTRRIKGITYKALLE